jgi:hypothetical protein
VRRRRHVKKRIPGYDRDAYGDRTKLGEREKLANAVARLVGASRIYHQPNITVIRTRNATMEHWHRKLTSKGFRQTSKAGGMGKKDWVYKKKKLVVRVTGDSAVEDYGRGPSPVGAIVYLER